MNSAELASPIKRHGGKTYLAEKLLELMPPRAKNSNRPDPEDPGWVHYVEPFFGGGSVLFAQDPEGISEVVNDIDGELTNFWDVLKSAELFADFQRVVSLTPCSEVEFERSRQISPQASPVERAAAFFVRNRQSRQALGKCFSTLSRNRTRRGMNELPSAWLSAIAGLPEVHRRLQRVVILNQSALKVIERQDDARTLFYLDPPYVHDTRTVTNAYDHEMHDSEHRQLLTLIAGIKGRFLLSGYNCPLYHEFASLHKWQRVDIEIDNKAGSGKEKRKMIECVWMNY
ncbi:MAG: DNA adenine methylase [Planctomycetes bacterium]|nr:DNA adenine methylase [Planctomycetota bacterium]